MDNVKPKFPKQADELKKLLEDDQKEWRQYALEEYDGINEVELHNKKQLLRKNVKARANRMLQIVEDVDEPSISNVGSEGALAIYILATHASLKVTRKVLSLFNNLYARDKEDTRFSSIPAMTDWIAILEHSPQKFGTIWLLDEHDYPFLPTVEDFKHVNERRHKYGIEDLRWPKSLAIPEDKQPWLARPLSELVVRDPNNEEYKKFELDYLS